MEPAVKPAVAATRTGVVGVLTTQATANGALYQRVVKRYAGDVQIITQVAPELVTIVEAQSQHTTEAQAIIRDYVAPMAAAGADQIALACTHFPFLMDTIQTIVGADIHLIDPGPAIARQVARVLPDSVLHDDAPINREENRYFTSGSSEHFRQALQTLIGVDAPVMAY
jgi:glutamate racemase